MHDPFSPYAERLFRFIELSPAPYASMTGGASSESAFQELALDLFRIQVETIPLYARYCANLGLAPSTVVSWRLIPALPVIAFKEFEVTSLPSGNRPTVFRSSGTTGSIPSRHFHDPQSLAIYEASALAWFRPHLLTELPARAQLLSLTPPPRQAPNSSLVHMIETVRRSRSWAADRYLSSCTASDDGWRLDGRQAVELLTAAAATAEPVLLLGTAFSFVTLMDLLAERRVAFQLPPGSRVMETGGYKGRSRALPRTELHNGIRRKLGVPTENVISEYGMSELSSQAYDGRIGSPETIRRFRFPPWARARIVSPETLAEVAPGETGLVEVVDLANLRSVLAIRTGDLAVRREDGFDLLGRTPSAEPRGCSLLASA